VTQYYHSGVVCHLVGHDVAVPLDVELCRPGEGEETAAKRLLERDFVLYPRYFDAVLGDALYLDAPFINFCRDHGKHAIVTIRGEHRLLLQDAQGLFGQQTCWGLPSSCPTFRPKNALRTCPAPPPPA
jgi:hypothetical protein